MSDDTHDAPETHVVTGDSHTELLQNAFVAIASGTHAPPATVLAAVFSLAVKVVLGAARYIETMKADGIDTTGASVELRTAMLELSSTLARLGAEADMAKWEAIAHQEVGALRGTRH